MIAQYHKLALTAGFLLAIALTFSCSGDGGGDNNPGGTSSAGISSSSGGGGSSSSGVSSGGGSSSSSGGGSSSGTGSSSSFGSSSSSAGGDIPIVGCPDAVTVSNAVTCGGKTYATVEIGGKIWMKENLKYNVVGSKCGDESTNTLKDGDTPACDTYGRLYNWSTAMALPSKCNSILSTSGAGCAIGTPNHRGICPSGWHIPSNAEWDALYRSADGTSGTDSPYISPTAGKDLKAQDGWTDCGPSGSGKANLCEDTYNFSALPGGYDSSNGSFDGVGLYGYWWSASELNSNYAYSRLMSYDGENAYYSNDDKSYLFSVRCLQD